MSEAERQKALNETLTAVTSEKLDIQTTLGSLGLSACLHQGLYSWLTLHF